MHPRHVPMAKKGKEKKKSKKELAAEAEAKKKEEAASKKKAEEDKAAAEKKKAGEHRQRCANTATPLRFSKIVLHSALSLPCRSRRSVLLL